MNVVEKLDRLFLLSFLSSLQFYDKEKFPKSQEAIKLNIFIMFDIEKMTLNTEYVNLITMYIIFSMTEIVSSLNRIQDTQKCV